MSTLCWRSKLSLILILWISAIWAYAQDGYRYPHKATPMKQTKLIFLGDSLVGWHDWRNFGAHINAGIPADSTADILYRIETIKQQYPHRVIIMAAINDLLNGITLEQVEQNYSQILDALNDTKELIILSTLPVRDTYQADQINADVIALNSFLRRQAHKRKLHYIDLHRDFVDEHSSIQPRYTRDGVHLSTQGYQLWEDILKKELLTRSSK